MFFILIVILHGIQIIALVCMISGPQFGIIFGSRIYVEKFEKNLDDRDFYWRVLRS